MPFEPVPTYAEVSSSKKDERTGKTVSSFNPVWLSWFLSLAKQAFSTVNLGSNEIIGILPLVHGGTGIDGSALPSGTVILAKITGGGNNGTLTFVNGLITAFTPPT